MQPGNPTGLSHSFKKMNIDTLTNLWTSCIFGQSNTGISLQQAAKSYIDTYFQRYRQMPKIFEKTGSIKTRLRP